mgnify:CR=1 FL=1
MQLVLLVQQKHPNVIIIKKINKILNTQTMRMTKNLLKMMTKSNLKKAKKQQSVLAQLQELVRLVLRIIIIKINIIMRKKILIKTISTMTNQKVRKKVVS